MKYIFANTYVHIYLLYGLLNMCKCFYTSMLLSLTFYYSIIAHFRWKLNIIFAPKINETGKETGKERPIPGMLAKEEKERERKKKRERERICKKYGFRLLKLNRQTDGQNKP